MKRLAKVCIALLITLAANGRVWADSFREIGVAPPRMSIVSPGGDPDANLPTDDIHPHPAVVRVIVPERGATSYGTGTLVDVHGEHGLVLTCEHVVRDAVSAPTVLFPDSFRSAARVVKVDRDWDLAALIIWRPNVAPVPVAAEPPRPGEPLAIAGYGHQGLYRLAHGRCTEYKQPNVRLPYEWVELKALARQGDSGGPIFNSRGELAGSLWGEGNGFTIGSYCGRVRQFLSAVVPNGDLPTDVQPLVVVPPRAVARRGTAGALVSRTSQVATSDSETWGRAAGTTMSKRPQSSVDIRPRDATPDVSASAADAQRFDWQALAGRTRAEQGKTLLAIIGAVALLVRARRIISEKTASTSG